MFSTAAAASKASQMTSAKSEGEGGEEKQSAEGKKESTEGGKDNAADAKVAEETKEGGVAANANASGAAKDGAASKGKAAEEDGDKVADLRQFSLIVTTLHPNATPQYIARLYREAYNMGGGEVTLKSFFAAADAMQLFSDCLQVPPYVGSAKWSMLSRKQHNALASLIHRRATLLDRDIGPWIQHLPEQHRERVLFLKVRFPRAALLRLLSLLCAVCFTPSTFFTSFLLFVFLFGYSFCGQAGVDTEIEEDGAGLNGDGLRPLVAYRRYLDSLLTVRMWNRELIGEMRGEYTVMQIDK
ncbi:unnamed protein product [Symbiodinium sp. KB8]|nr:unnamed protein product [Symbiodinium sp. KB8]